MSGLIDLIGQKFGRLTVVKRAEDHIQPSGQHKTQWLCKCDCGNECITQGVLLRRNEVRSCGCLNNELVIIRNKQSKKYNTYDLSGEYGIGYTLKGEEFYFDLEDYELIKDYCWHITSKGYVVSQKNQEHERTVQHRLVMNFPNEFEIDHIHQENKNDNRKSNLRICSHIKNSMNRGVRPDNKIGITGVYKEICNGREKWVARIKAHGKEYKKRFIDFDAAVKQRKEWEEQLFSDYSYTNSQKVEVV